MEPEFNWLSLPDHNLEIILLFLDFNTLLKATETCKKLQLICAKSSKLCRKIRLKVIIDENLTSELSAVKNSQRKYCNLLLTPFWKDEWRSQSERPIDDEILQSIKDIFGDTVQNESLKGLKSISLKQVLPVNKDDNSDAMVDDEFDPRDQHELFKKYKLPTIETLEMFESHFFLFSFFKRCTRMRKLVLNSNCRVHIACLENALAKFKNLKELKLRKFKYDHFYASDLLGHPPFQLESISMNEVCWDRRDVGVSFFLTQRNLKSFDFALKYQYWNRERNGAEHERYNDIVKHVFTSNHDLTSVEISTNEREGYNIRITAFLEKFCAQT